LEGLIEIKSAAQIVAMAPVCMAARRADIIFRLPASSGFLRKWFWQTAAVGVD